MSDTPNAIWIGRNDSALGPHPIEKIRATVGKDKATP